MIVLGVDPGVSGAMAIVDGDSLKFEMFRRSGNGIDVVAAAKWIIDHEPDIAVVELVHSFPSQGVKGVFTFGKATGQILGALSALGVPVEEVSPSKWKPEMLGRGKSKKDSIEACMSLFPGVELMTDRQRVPNHNIAEAVLIAKYWTYKVQYPCKPESHTKKKGVRNGKAGKRKTKPVREKEEHPPLP